MSAQPGSIRAGAPVVTQARRYGLLTDLIGTWAGSGISHISKPGHDVGASFVLQVNTTKEILTFDPIPAGPVPDRGSIENDLIIYALGYTQLVSDAPTSGLLHVERGMWLNLSAGDPPRQAITRLATIPHGDSVLAQGAATSYAGPPTIPVANSQPTVVDGKPIDAGYYPPDPPFPPRVDPPMPPDTDLRDLNIPLREVIQGQTITRTIELQVSTKATELESGGGILNIPFVTKNADAISLDSTFWIETVQPQTGPEFLQLQYTQTVVLRFPDTTGRMIDWPHISLGTLIKN